METKRKVLFIADIILIILTLTFIWGHSLISQAESAVESEQVYNTFQEVFDTLFGAGVITEGILRKIAHFSEFLLLSLELNFLFVILKNNRAVGFTFSLFFGLFTAFFDETLQIFSGRGASINDVIIDFSAVVFITAVFIAIYVLKKRKKNIKDN